MAESIRGKVIRDLIARFSNDLLIGKKIKSGELRKRAVDLEPEWKCPEQFTNTMILMENFTMELLEPVENVGSRVVLRASWRRIYCHDEECIPFVCGTLQ